MHCTLVHMIIVHLNLKPNPKPKCLLGKVNFPSCYAETKVLPDGITRQYYDIHYMIITREEDYQKSFIAFLLKFSEQEIKVNMSCQKRWFNRRMNYATRWQNGVKRILYFRLHESSTGKKSVSV